MPQFEDKQPAPSSFEKAPVPPAPQPQAQPQAQPSFLDRFVRANQQMLSIDDSMGLFGGLYDGPQQAPAPAPQRAKPNPWSTSALMMDAHKSGMQGKPSVPSDPIGNGLKKAQGAVQGLPPSVDTLINMTSTAVQGIPDLPPSVGAPLGGVKLGYDLLRKGPSVDTALDAAKLGAMAVPGAQVPLALMGLVDSAAMLSGNPQLSSNELIKSGGRFLRDGAIASTQAQRRPGHMGAVEHDSIFEID